MVDHACRQLTHEAAAAGGQGAGKGADVDLAPTTAATSTTRTMRQQREGLHLLLAVAAERQLTRDAPAGTRTSCMGGCCRCSSSQRMVVLLLLRLAARHIVLVVVVILGAKGIRVEALAVLRTSSRRRGGLWARRRAGLGGCVEPLLPATRATATQHGWRWWWWCQGC